MEPFRHSVKIRRAHTKAFALLVETLYICYKTRLQRFCQNLKIDEEYWLIYNSGWIRTHASSEKNHLITSKGYLILLPLLWVKRNTGGGGDGGAGSWDISLLERGGGACGRRNVRPGVIFIECAIDSSIFFPVCARL